MAGIRFVQGPAFAIAAAVLFGISTPVSKLLLSDIDPVLFAALLYLGSGLGLLLVTCVRNRGRPPDPGLRLGTRDLPWLIGGILTGGVFAPIVLLVCLAYVPAATASLLLNFEIVATTLIASLVFREYLGRLGLLAIPLIAAAGVILSADFQETSLFSPAAAGIVLASIFWGIDNNLTRKISGKDPVVIATSKGLAAGFVSLGIAVFVHAPVPSPGVIVAALVAGFFTYGLSIVFFVRSLRELGAARTSAYFAAAPFIGALLSLILFGGVPGLQFFIALPLFIAGAGLLAREQHSHAHSHGPLVHDHPHVPEVHHGHER